MIHIAIVEDEELYAKQLKNYLHQYEKEKEIRIQISRFHDGDEITEDYSGTYDIILMDIQMRFMDGMTAAERIRELDSDVVIIFITNMTEYAIRGYEVSALDYVVKPIEYISFARKIDRAISTLKVEKNYISVPTEGGMKRLDLEQILYVEVRDHTLFYHTENETIQAKGRGTMRNVEETLVSYGFFRCSNCSLVNLNMVDGVMDGFCMMKHAKVQISRTRKKAFMNALVQCINGGEY